MKKQFVFLTLLLTMLTSGLVAQTVFVTKTGKKYHDKNCIHLSKSSIAISLEDAVAKGYTACKNCMPESTNKTTPKDTVKTVNKEVKNEEAAPR
jgi:methylphosphotriester-DNA--protein-cysteine methyltransferase